jgi:NAD-dependent deacetylase
VGKVKYPESLKERVKTAKNVAVLTGAGISQESGIHTFRGADGLWKKFRPEELANFDAFIKRPEIVWEWYNYRKELIQNVEPNPGHFALVELERIFPIFYIITQNIDDLHKRAGSSNIIELHGNIYRNYCIDCGKRYDGQLELRSHIIKGNAIPKCDCGGVIRPDVVWFGEMLPENSVEKAFEVARGADIFFSIGTSAIVYPAAYIPRTAKSYGAFLVEVNVDWTDLSTSADYILKGKSGEVLPDLVEWIKQTRGPE